MNTNLKRFFLCPIPEDQKPINFYEGIKENYLMNWTTLSQKKYQNYLFSFFLSCFLINCLIRLAWLPTLAYLLEWIIINLLLSLGTLIIFLSIIFFRWKQIEKMFISPKIFYEEGSWSDGQIWEKPSFILKTDQLIKNQKISPILKRILRTIYSLSSLVLGFILFFEVI